MLVATNGKESHKVHLAHWWPGRYFEGWTGSEGIFNKWFTMKKPPIPYDLVLKCLDQETRYLTYASVTVGNSAVQTCAMCCPRDNPSRRAGRFIALLRLARALRGMGYRLEQT